MRAVFPMIVLVALVPRPGSAQDIATSFEELRGQIRSGETLFVTDTRGTPIEGRLAGLAGSTLEIRLGRNQNAPALRMSESDVNNIVVVRRDRVWDGALIGFAVGAGIGVAIELGNGGANRKFQGGGAVALGNLCAITGLIFDLFNKDKVTVFVQKSGI